MIFLDSETCGLHGFIVLLQYAEDDGPIQLWDIWRKPISETLELLEYIASQEICGFNLAFDWFHLYKCYSTFSMAPDYDWIPIDHIEEIAVLEEKARNSTICLKPKKACDLMLHARRGPYQSLMNRNDIRVRRVPSRLAEALRRELEKRIKLDDIYFSRRKDKYAPRWQLRDIKLPNGDINPDFKDIVLKFHASGALKTLAKHALGVEEEFILKFVDVEPYGKPKELGFAPYALAIGKPSNWKNSWPDYIVEHVNHWYFNKNARQYGTNDVDYTRQLYNYFGAPEAGDIDSELACMVGCVRWRGFKIDIEKLIQRRDEAKARLAQVPRDPRRVKEYLLEVMNKTQSMVLNEGTKKEVLERIAEKWTGEVKERAQAVIDARRAKKEIEIYDKLILAGRFHASFKVIGTLSSRMSGDSKLNAQAINKKKEIRECFPFAWDDMILVGGDFKSFEVAISEAVYKDPQLRADLLSGKKIHALFAQELFPEHTYEEIVASEKTDNDMYDAGKRGIFGMNYGGNEKTLENRLKIDPEIALKAYEGFAKRYPGIGVARQKIKNKFCSMRQPGGIGTKVEWHEPADKMESLLGFPRYFTLENKICKTLFDLAQKLPSNWKDIRIRVKRRDRVQTAAGAVQSALYAAAFNIQSSNMRAAANHEIQSTGGEITKDLQKRLWDKQPHGVYPWQVMPMNVHDEINCPVHPDKKEEIQAVVDKLIEDYKPIIPLIAIDWKEMKTWADK